MQSFSNLFQLIQNRSLLISNVVAHIVNFIVCKDKVRHLCFEVGFFLLHTITLSSDVQIPEQNRKWREAGFSNVYHWDKVFGERALKERNTQISPKPKLWIYPWVRCGFSDLNLVSYLLEDISHHRWHGRFCVFYYQIRETTFAKFTDIQVRAA